MNPWALLVILLGILLVIIGVKGSQHEVVGTVTGKNPVSNTPANTGKKPAVDPNNPNQIQPGQLG